MDLLRCFRIQMISFVYGLFHAMIRFKFRPIIPYEIDKVLNAAGLHAGRSIRNGSKRQISSVGIYRGR